MNICLQKESWCSLIFILWISFNNTFFYMHNSFHHSQLSAFSPPLFRPCREWWGKREPSRGAQHKKKEEIMHFTYKIWQDNQTTLLTKCISGFGNKPKYLIFSSKKCNFWKKLFSRQHNSKKLYFKKKSLSKTNPIFLSGFNLFTLKIIDEGFFCLIS